MKKEAYVFESMSDFIHSINYQALKKKKKPITSTKFFEIIENKEAFYKNFSLPKKNGKKRSINEPLYELKEIQRYLNQILSLKFYSSNPHKCINGFVLNRGIRTNAEPHIGKKYLLNMDILDFFGSINAQKVQKYLSYSPFKISRTNRVNKIISDLVTFKGGLPQGSPTSPIISNIVCKDFDFAMLMLAKKYKLKYSRYADDISFSTNQEIDFKSFENTVTQKCFKHGFKVNKKKSRLLHANQRQSVTGIVTNTKLSIKREYLKITRAMLHNWKTKGYKDAQEIFMKNAPPKSGKYLHNVVLGRINFISHIIGNEHPISRRLIENYWQRLNCIDYGFVMENDSQKKLFSLNREAEKISLDKSFSSNQIDRFLHYTSKCFQQMEELHKYYFYEKFEGDFSQIGGFLFDSSPNIQNYFKNKKDKISSEEQLLEKARIQACNQTSFKSFNASQLEYIFFKENYYLLNRNLKKEHTYIRRVRNYYTHNSPMTKMSENTLREEAIKIKQRRNIEIINHSTISNLHPNEKKVFEDLRLYNWINKSPFDEVRKFLFETVENVQYLKRTIESNRKES